MRFEIPKDEWGPGPWQHEPDELRWVDKVTGLRCLIVRGSIGALCGYVGVQPDHPAYELDCSGEPADVARARRERFRENLSFWDKKDLSSFPVDEEPHQPVSGVGDVLNEAINVHGGLSFAGHLTIPDQYIGIDGDIWWFGFDCAHAGDLVPGVNAALRKFGIEPTRSEHWNMPPDRYRDFNYVRENVLALAKQLKALEVKVPEYANKKSGS